MSIGRATAAALSTTVEATMALANLNFDFSLVRVEAPIEYQPIKSALSLSRTREAEEGSCHITARKLGALFKGIAPNTPHLFRAYGRRASEIIQSEAHNPRGTQADGIFAEQVGADGTSIWAAATSGNDSIAVHLLACMLARLWTGAEATSLWVELVNERQRILTLQEDQDPCIVAPLSAARISLTRDQLATWDASARSWLHTADQVKEAAQKQLLLIINNLGIEISNRTTVYESVIKVWTAAMTMMDGLIAGIPQSATQGGPLLGLSSWHIYPDMMVLVGGSKLVKQNDEVVTAGGVLTVGLKTRGKADQGIVWSLPLSFHRYYGDPLIVKGSYNDHQARVSIEDFHVVALGSLLSSWFQDLSSFPFAIAIIHAIYETTKVELGPNAMATWPGILGSAAQSYCKVADKPESEPTRLIKIGRRRYSGFLRPDPSLSPLFGLMNPPALLSLLQDEEARVAFLRHVAKGLGVSGRLFIQYRHTWPTTIGHETFECASVEDSPPSDRPRKRRKHAGFEGHCRWLQESTNNDQNLDSRVCELKLSGERVGLLPIMTAMPHFGSYYCWRQGPCDFINSIAPSHSSSTDNYSIEFRSVFGDPNIAALYVVLESVHHDVEEISIVPANDIIHALNQKLVSPKRLADHLSHCTKVFDKQDTLRGLATISKALGSAHSAKIPLKLASQKIGRYRWATSARDSRSRTNRATGDGSLYPLLSPYSLSVPETFSCLVMIESGSFDIDPATLGSVAAISTGNYLYIASQLLYDPLEFSAHGQVQRVVGNLGRPGIALMVPPKELRLKTRNEEDWRCINHYSFDGSEQDCFQFANLHLGFSEWQMPVNLGSHGFRDAEAFFVEAFVSLYDHGDWVADLDVLGAFLNDKMSLLDVSAAKHSFSSLPTHSTCNRAVTSHLVSIDSWDELLDPPLEHGVVRASGNWQARLAAAALSVQRGHKTIVLPKSPCWSCFLSYADYLEAEAEAKDEGEGVWDYSGSEVSENDGSDQQSHDDYEECEPTSSSQDDVTSTTIYIL